MMDPPATAHYKFRSTDRIKADSNPSDANDLFQSDPYWQRASAMYTVIYIGFTFICTYYYQSHGRDFY